MDSSDRFLFVEGVLNCRRVGGYPSCFGRQGKIRDGLLYRSGHLAEITEAGYNTLQAEGVRTIFDLTSLSEHQLFTFSPTYAQLRSQIRRVPLETDQVSLKSMLQQYYMPANLDTEHAVAKNMRFIRNASSKIGHIVTHISTNPSEPVLIHCTLGKDRTGILIALLLAVLGVPLSTVAREYALTTAALAEAKPTLKEYCTMVMPDLRKPDDLVKDIINAREQDMKATLHAIEQQYSSFSTLMTDHCGVSMENIANLRAHLVE